MSSIPRYINTSLYYHVFNCGVEKRILFQSQQDYERFLEILRYYSRDQRIRFTQYLLLKPVDKVRYCQLNNDDQTAAGRVKILTYCLMPNHFHLLVRPMRLTGLSAFMSDLSNSYTRYFNSKYGRIGALLQGTFKAKGIDNRESFLHVSRYIHLNPIRSFYTNADGKIKKPENYPYSSYREWLEPEKASLVDGNEVYKILDQQKQPAESYREFVESSLNKNPVIGIEEFLLEV